ncbi:MAG: D-serine ammonia-lyase [Victivallales bacterium]|nr:D-serine ammonia-lyase [Victivallales bacterium]MCF7888660.1 D-serine ammonia-lyase [Victivallales bacterium]
MNTELIKELADSCPLIKNLIEFKETFWFNPNITTFEEGLPYVGLTADDVKNAAERLKRFAPYIAKVFPETSKYNGIIESGIENIEKIKTELAALGYKNIKGDLLLKKDSHLPVSGSIKARGGIYEVLKYAEDLAVEANLLSYSDNYEKLCSKEFTDFFSRYSIAVGSTGNLGLSIGIISAALGFNVFVHMSADASQWKKDRLRFLGVNVIEYNSDYSIAVEKARKGAENNPLCFFVDDENSRNLFLGYSVAGERVRKQLEDMNITVDVKNPLFVYLPCGVGGGPGGVAFGLKLAFGDNVHCIFAEPTHSPCMFLGVYTGMHDKISVRDIGIDNITAADGLAVGRASGFVGRAMKRLIDGYYTVEDRNLYCLLALLNKTEKIKLEPSALAGMLGPVHTSRSTDYLKFLNIDTETMKNAKHLVWATGGGMVPDKEFNEYIKKAELISLRPFL